MIRTRQKTLTSFQRSSTSSFASHDETTSMKKLITMNETFDTFNTQIIEALEISNYVTLQRELDQLNKKRRRIELLREMQKISTIKTVEFSEVIFAMSTNRSEIDDLQKKKFFKIVNSKKYKNITQHDLNIFIRECNKVFEIRHKFFYPKIAIIRRINAIVFRLELKEIVRLTKKIESISNHIKKTKKSNSFENVKQYLFQLYSRIDWFDFDASQNAIQNNDRDDDRDRKNYKERDRENRDDRFDNDTNRFQVMCWNCERRDHYNNDCKKSFQNDQNIQKYQNNKNSKKIQDQST